MRNERMSARASTQFLFSSLQCMGNEITNFGLPDTHFQIACYDPMSFYLRIHLHMSYCTYWDMKSQSICSLFLFWHCVCKCLVWNSGWLAHWCRSNCYSFFGARKIGKEKLQKMEWYSEVTEDVYYDLCQLFFEVVLFYAMCKWTLKHVSVQLLWKRIMAIVGPPKLWLFRTAAWLSTLRAGRYSLSGRNGRSGQGRQVHSAAEMAVLARADPGEQTSDSLVCQNGRESSVLQHLGLENQGCQNFHILIDTVHFIFKEICLTCPWKKANYFLYL